MLFETNKFLFKINEILFKVEKLWFKIEKVLFKTKKVEVKMLRKINVDDIEILLFNSVNVSTIMY